MHYVSLTCQGVRCSMCGLPATHKVGEEIAHDDPNPIRHNLTAYVCCAHFTTIMGLAWPCDGVKDWYKGLEELRALGAYNGVDVDAFMREVRGDDQATQ